MSPIVKFVYLQEKAEGSFRFNHVHVRTRSESIAFMNGEASEEIIANAKLHDLIETQNKLITRTLWLDVSVNYSSYFGAILSFMLIAIPIFTGRLDHLKAGELSSLISQNSFVCMYLIHKLTTVLEMSQKFVTVAGTSHRIIELVQVLEDQQTLNKHSCEWKQGEDLFYEISNLKVENNHKILLKNVNMSIGRRKNVFIHGPSGSGKTSLLRVIRGLWDSKCGQISICSSNDRIFFAPQIPILTSGSIADQITYPKHTKSFSTRDIEKMREILKFLDVSHMLKRTDNNLLKTCDWNWYQVLSPGEIQRMVFARVFYQKPDLLIIDEGTNAVSIDLEEKIYGRLAQEGITVLTLGHRTSLMKFHSVIYKIENQQLVV